MQRTFYEVNYVSYGFSLFILSYKIVSQISVRSICVRRGVDVPTNSEKIFNGRLKGKIWIVMEHKNRWSDSQHNYGSNIYLFRYVELGCLHKDQ